MHHLANLGGLIALAGLDLEPPDFLLGALLSVAQEAGDLTRRSSGRTLRRSGGRSSTNGRPASARGSHGGARRICTRSRSAAGSCAEIIEALGGQAPENPTKLVLALSEALTEVCDETA